MSEGYNVDLMIEVREHIRANPEQHNQAQWAARTECGTTYCIAGWAVQLAGKKIHWHEDWGTAAFVETPTGQAGGQIEYAAHLLLGLDQFEADWLFFSGSQQALALLDKMIEAGKNGERIRLDPT